MFTTRVKPQQTCLLKHASCFQLLPGLMIFCHSMKVTLQSPHPNNPEQGYIQLANQQPTKQFLILQTVTFASCASNLWEQVFDFQRYIRFSLMLKRNLPGLQQSLSPDRDPVETEELYHPHDNIVCSPLFDENKKSNPSVCHKLLSIFGLLKPICSRTKECQVYQSVTNTSISQQSESTNWAILQLLPILPP